MFNRINCDLLESVIQHKDKDLLSKFRYWNLDKDNKVFKKYAEKAKKPFNWAPIQTDEELQCMINLYTEWISDGRYRGPLAEAIQSCIDTFNRIFCVDNGAYYRSYISSWMNRYPNKDCELVMNINLNLYSNKEIGFQLMAPAKKTEDICDELAQLSLFRTTFVTKLKTNESYAPKYNTPIGVPLIHFFEFFNGRYPNLINTYNFNPFYRRFGQSTSGEFIDFVAQFLCQVAKKGGIV